MGIAKRRTASISAVGLVLATFGAVAASAQSSFEPIPPLGAGNAEAQAISGNGMVVVGFSGPLNAIEAVRWTQGDAGWTSLGFLPGGSESSATGVNYDGSVVVGYGNSTNAGNEAFRWVAGETPQMTGLGFLSGGNSSRANGVSANGSVVVGYSNKSVDGNDFEAFRWEDGEMTGIGVMAGGSRSYAYGVSGDGRVVVGYGDSSLSLDEAFRWEEGVDAAPVGLGFLNDADRFSEASATDDDGSVVVGYSRNTSGNYEAFRWTEESGQMAGLGFVVGENASQAFDVNADGSVVVGSSGGKAFRWQAIRREWFRSPASSATPASI